MKLWHLSATKAARDLKRDDGHLDVLDPYEEAHEWIVRADTPERAREIVVDRDERIGFIWHLAEYSTCEELPAEGEECIILGG